MEWTQEAIQAEVERRHEVAQHSALVRQLRVPALLAAVVVASAAVASWAG